MVSRMLNRIVTIDDDEEELNHLSENDKIIARRQKILDSTPKYGSKEHYKGQKERNIRFNKEIQKAYNDKSLYQIDVENYLDLKSVIGSDAHFRGMIVELLTMNYLLKQDAENGFVSMPQFSTDSFDNGRDIIVGKKNIECKGESPVFIGNGISFPIDQKRKVLEADDLFLAIYGSKDGEHNWMCGYLWLFHPKTMPETEWDDYPVGVVGKSRIRFGHNMGTGPKDYTPWAKPVAKISPKIYNALVCASGSLYERDVNFRKEGKTKILPWGVFVNNQRRKHGW